MIEPPRGVCTDCRVVRVIDGDTVVVSAFGRDWHIRLLDCAAPEKRGSEKAAGLAAKTALELLVATANRFSLFIPAADNGSMVELFTLGRVLGRVFADGEDISEFMVRHGHAKPWTGR